MAGSTAKNELVGRFPLGNLLARIPAFTFFSCEVTVSLQASNVRLQSDTSRLSMLFSVFGQQETKFALKNLRQRKLENNYFKIRKFREKN